MSVKGLGPNSIGIRDLVSRFTATLGTTYEEGSTRRGWTGLIEGLLNGAGCTLYSSSAWSSDFSTVSSITMS
jgi:hypothetical protein